MSMYSNQTTLELYAQKSMSHQKGIFTFLKISRKYKEVVRREAMERVSCVSGSPHFPGSRILQLKYWKESDHEYDMY